MTNLPLHNNSNNHFITPLGRQHNTNIINNNPLVNKTFENETLENHVTLINIGKINNFGSKFLAQEFNNLNKVTMINGNIKNLEK